MKLGMFLKLAALALVGAAGTASAAVVAPSFGDCPGMSINPEVPSSAVLSSTIAGTPTSYNFKVCNTSFNPRTNETQGPMFLLRDWELPYDPAGGIANITTPTGWGWAIETIGVANPATGWDGAVPTWFDPSDPFYDARYLGLATVLHFYTCSSGGVDTAVCPEATDGSPFGDALAPGESLEGFGFTSPFGPTNAPYQASWVTVPPRSGDPDFPLTGAPDTPGLRNSVPEPGSLALLGGGLLLAAWRRRVQRG